MLSRNFRVLIPVALLLSGCSVIDLTPNDEKENYKNALLDAAVIESSEVMSLPLISEGRVKVVTWTAYPDSYEEGQESILQWGDVWVTLDNDVKSRCQNFKQEKLPGDIQKLLGLPLDNTQKRSFVTLEVDSSSLFRPCANPSIKADKCTSNFPEDVPLEHLAWFAAQTAMSYQIESGYPWTRLGYTYNWKSGESEVGPAEFVIKKGSKATILAVVNTNHYCAN